MGTFLKDKHEGPFIEEWKEVSKSEFEFVNMATQLYNVLSLKLEREQKNVKSASTIAQHIFRQKVVPLIEHSIDNPQASVTHSKLAQDIEKVFEDPSKISKKVCLVSEQMELELTWFFCLVHARHFGSSICANGSKWD